MRPISSFVDTLQGVIVSDEKDDEEWTDIGTIFDDSSNLVQASPSSPLPYLPSSSLSYLPSSTPFYSSDTPPSLVTTYFTSPVSSSSPAWTTPHRYVNTPTPSPQPVAPAVLKNTWSLSEGNDSDLEECRLEREGSFEDRVDALLRRLTVMVQGDNDGY
jgi:hypothetical protein